MPGRDGLLVLAENEGMPEGRRAAGHAGHRLGGAGAPRVRAPVPRRVRPVAVHDQRQPVRRRGRVGTAAAGQGAGRGPGASCCPGCAPAAARQLSGHFDAMLEANGLAGRPAFRDRGDRAHRRHAAARGLRPGPRSGSRRPSDLQERRVAVLTQTMSGVLDTFRTRVPALAAQVDDQLALRAELLAAGRRLPTRPGWPSSTRRRRNGSLLRGEILARWQDFTGTGDLLRMLQVRRSGRPRRPRKRRIPARAKALKSAVRDGLETLVTALADRAAEDTVARWQQHDAGRRAARRGRGRRPGPPDAAPVRPGRRAGLPPGQPGRAGPGPPGRPARPPWPGPPRTCPPAPPRRSAPGKIT